MQDLVSNIADPDLDPQEQLLRKQDAQQLQLVLQSLSAEHRAVLMLRELEGLNYDQIANVVGANKGTVMSRLHYARKSLQKALGGSRAGDTKQHNQGGARSEKQAILSVLPLAHSKEKADVS